jgi:hypothetical protein
LVRHVTEHPDQVRTSDARNDPSSLNGSLSKRRGGEDDPIDDPDLISLNADLKKLEKEFGKTTQEIAEIFCKVSGRVNKMRDYLENKPGIVEWNYLEDLALAKPEDTAEF